jgi:hypothetical protein
MAVAAPKPLGITATRRKKISGGAKIPQFYKTGQQTSPAVNIMLEHRRYPDKAAAILPLRCFPFIVKNRPFVEFLR